MSICYDLIQRAQKLRDEQISVSAEPAPADARPSGELQPVPIIKVDIQPANRLVFHTDPSGPGADRFRFLRMHLRELWTSKHLRVLLVTSPLPQDGKSTVALNLAAALAERGRRRVLLIDADLHHSSLTRQLRIEPGPGLTECLEAGLNPVLALRYLEPLNWYLLPAGAAPADAAEQLQSETLPGIISTLRGHFDWIVMDSPPLTPLTDALSLAKQADATLLVARAERTPHEAVEKAIGLLGREHVLGILLNGTRDANRLYSKYYGHYANV